MGQKDNHPPAYNSTMKLIVTSQGVSAIKKDVIAIGSGQAHNPTMSIVTTAAASFRTAEGESSWKNR